MADLVLTRRAKEDLKALPRLVLEAVAQTLTLLEAEPETLGKELRGRLRGLWSCRVGSYRILYTIEGRRARTRVVVWAIRHRGIAYPKRRGSSGPSV
ncbi:MAG: type II toxin-antitoxin system RelE family toxin [Actinomycetota bacterium]